MLHKIHMGADLANASTYAVVGFGGTSHFYDEVHFPALPDGTKKCTACHGEDNEAWIEPGDRDHSTEQVAPVREWTVVCGSCHDADESVAHYELQTSGGGVESCAVCHGEGKDNGVEVSHKVY
jgi:predicted CXXCH cytochrome family protein